MIVQAITTKYLGPTNTRGSRIKAMAAAGSVTIDYDDALNSEKAHAKAACLTTVATPSCASLLSLAKLPSPSMTAGRP